MPSLVAAGEATRTEGQNVFLSPRCSLRSILSLYDPLNMVPHGDFFNSANSIIPDSLHTHQASWMMQKNLSMVSSL